MKTILISLLTICAFSISNAQPPKQELLNLLRSKHDYERILHVKTKDARSLKVKYTESYAKIKKDKYKIISYINNALKVDSAALSKEFIFYKYQSPLSSYVDFENRISLLTYFKIVKHSLENSKFTLPAL